MKAVSVSAPHRRKPSLRVLLSLGALCGLWLAVANGTGAPVARMPRTGVPVAAAGSAVVHSDPRPEPVMRDRSSSRQQERGPREEASPQAHDVAIALRTLAAVEADFRARFEANPLFADYSACLARDHEPCETQFSDVVYSVMFGGFVSDLEAERDLPAPGTKVAQIAAADLARTIADTDDPVRRAAALLIVTRVDGLSVHELPDRAYEGLSSLSTVEQQLLLERHAFLPLPNAEVAAEVAAFGRIASDPRALESAVLALGHPSTDVELAALLADVEPDQSLRRSLSRVVGACANECPRTIQFLLATQRSDDRAALAQAVNFCPDTKVDALRATVRQLSAGEVELPPQG